MYSRRMFINYKYLCQFRLAPPAGLEPATPGFEDQCAQAEAASDRSRGAPKIIIVAHIFVSLWVGNEGRIPSLSLSQ